MDEPPYHVEIEGVEGPSADRSAAALRARPWVGVHFDCCGAYTRIYRNLEGTAYQGRCPRCGRAVRLRVGPGGTDARFFVAK